MTKNLKRILSLCLVLALITAMALTMVSCDKKTDATDGTKGTLPTETTEATAPKALGTFTLTVTFADGSKQTEDYTYYEKGDLGTFLVENGIAQGDDGQYGLYIKTVLGETHDYDTDASYWAFYIDGEMAMTGVSDTELTDGANYELKAAE